MYELTVGQRDDGAFDVEVRAAGSVTRHVVTVPEGLATELGVAGTDPAELVRRSFEFLLEREPPSSILRSFSLEVIERYFPEYRAVVSARLI